MLVQRINRMVLGVASPVSRFVTALTGTAPIEVDQPDAIDAAGDLLVVGRQQHRDDGSLRLGFEVLEAARALPRRVIYVLPDRFTEARYARDLRSLGDLANRGHRVMVLELAALRDLGDAAAIAGARPVFDETAPGVFGLVDGRRLSE